jgi:RNA polymerase sigma-70 factor, ECF subfamily
MTAPAMAGAGVPPNGAAMGRADRDRSLLDALRRRDTSAAESLVATYGDRAYRLAMSITGNAHDAEEVVQDALWNVIRRIETFRGQSAFGSWLYRIVANAAYQKLRGRSRRRAEISFEDLLPSFHEDGRHAEPIADWSAGADDPSRSTELRLVLQSAMDQLPPDYRSVLMLRDVEGLGNAEVADALGITIASVKSRTHRARMFLRQRLATALAA